MSNHLERLEEAKKRDHRLIGKQMNLFSFHEEGPGFAFPVSHRSNCAVLVTAYGALGRFAFSSRPDVPKRRASSASI